MDQSPFGSLSLSSKGDEVATDIALLTTASKVEIARLEAERRRLACNIDEARSAFRAR